ncbi:hypothetical protein D3C76_1104620 [compost metagenome]
MCIINMKSNLVWQRFYRNPKLGIGTQNTLQPRATEEILLLQAKQLTFVLRVIWVKELRNGFYRTLILQKLMIVRPGKRTKGS